MHIRPTIDRVGHGAALFFALFTGLGPAGLYLGLFGMLVCAFATPAFWRWATGHALFWIAVAWCAYIALRAALPNEFPTVNDQYEDMRDGMVALTGIYGFILGWWMRERETTRRRVFLLLPVGMMFGVGYMTEPEHWQRLFAGEAFYGHMRGNASALYGAIVIIGCLTLGWPALRERPLSPGMRIAARGALVLLIVMCSALIMASQARSVMLAVAVTVVVFLIARACARYAGDTAGPARTRMRVAIITGAIAVPLTIIAGGVIASALVGFEGNLGAVLAGEPDQLARNSLGYRLAMLDVAIRTFAAHPLLGAGFGITAGAIEAADHDVLHLNHFHFHNLYLQVATMTGLVGLGFLFGVIGTALRYTWSGLGSSRPGVRRLARFTLYAGLLFLVVSLFQVRFDDPPGLALIALLIACALICREATPTRNASEPHP